MNKFLFTIIVEYDGYFTSYSFMSILIYTNYMPIAESACVHTEAGIFKQKMWKALTKT